MASPEVIVRALRNYEYCRSVEGDDNLSIKEGQCFYLVEKHSSEWWVISHPEFKNNVYVPASYVREIGAGLSPQDVLENNDRTVVSRDENHNHGEPHYANLAAIQSHIHGNKDDDDDDDDGVPHYYNLQNIKDALKRPPPKPGKEDKPADTIGDNWQVYVDRSCDRKYYYNTKTDESTWKPPRGVRSKPPVQQVEKRASMPVVNLVPEGWQEHQSDDQTYYVHEISGDKWFKSESDDGRVYYYSAAGGDSSWHLPLSEDLPAAPLIPSTPKPLPPLPVIKTSTENVADRHSPSPQEPVNFSTVFGSGVEKKRGFLNKKKVVENHKKINFRKNWSLSFVVLSDLTLYFYKDEKAAQNKPSSPTGKPEFQLDLAGATIKQGAKGDVIKLGPKGEIKSSKKNLILVVTLDGNGYFLQHDDDNTIHQWYTVLSNNVTILSKQGVIRGSQGSLGSLDSELGLDEMTPSPGLRRKGTTRKELSHDRRILDDPNISITEKKGIVNEILRKLIPKRPDVATLQDKGIIKDAVFGCQSITKLCNREKTTVPKFVTECLAAIEHKGLDADGLYRISGNLATIQKLRFMVDQDEHYDLLSPEMDINVLTGALKLFFRELKEPLFPFSQYEAFIQAISHKNRDLKIRAIGDQIKKLPKANHETMKKLFKHLTKVIENSRENRMHVQNIAIVFGPTLMWPEVEKGNVAVSMVYQNQVVECILQNYSSFF